MAVQVLDRNINCKLINKGLIFYYIKPSMSQPGVKSALVLGHG